MITIGACAPAPSIPTQSRLYATDEASCNAKASGAERKRNLGAAAPLSESLFESTPHFHLRAARVRSEKSVKASTFGEGLPIARIRARRNSLPRHRAGHNFRDHWVSGRLQMTVADNRPAGCIATIAQVTLGRRRPAAPSTACSCVSRQALMFRISYSDSLNNTYRLLRTTPAVLVPITQGKWKQMLVLGPGCCHRTRKLVLPGSDMANPGRRRNASISHPYSACSRRTSGGPAPN